MTTVKEILEMPGFSQLLLLNPKADLDRPIETVEIADSPDIVNHIPENAFVITTELSCAEGVECLTTLIRGLAQQKTAGLAIKMGRLMPTISQSVLAIADELQFPLVQIPMSMNIGKITHQIFSTLADEHTQQNSLVKDIQQKFVDLIALDSPIDQLITELSQLCQQSVLLVDPFGHVINESSDKDFLKDKVSKQVLLKKIQEFQKLRQSDTFLFAASQEKLKVTVFPLSTDQYLPYMLVLASPEKEAHSVSHLAIQQYLTVLALSLYKEQTAQNELRAERRSLLMYLLNNKNNPQEEDWENAANDFPIALSDYYRVVYMEALIPKDQQQYEKEIDHLISTFLFTHVEKTDEKITLFPTSERNRWVLIVQKKKDMLPILEEVHQYLDQLLGVYTRFGLGDPVNQINLLHFSFNESKNALEETGEGFIHYNKIQSVKRIAENMSQEDRDYFCLSILKNLAYPENPADLEMRKTLTTYLDKQCEIAKTADALFVHRNTVKYRIKKCEKLFSSPIDDAEFSLQLRVALFLSEAEQ